MNGHKLFARWQVGIVRRRGEDGATHGDADEWISDDKGDRLCTGKVQPKNLRREENCSSSIEVTLV